MVDGFSFRELSRALDRDQSEIKEAIGRALVTLRDARQVDTGSS